MAGKRRPRTKEIVAEVERFLGERVLKMSAPGGKGRDSYRVHLKDRTVFVTYRDGSPRGMREALILEHLSPLCSQMPPFLGFENGYLYQGDVGEKRLSLEVLNADTDRQVDLAAAGVAAIFRIQEAARKTRVLDDLPHLGATPQWSASVLASVEKLCDFLKIGVPDYDQQAVFDRIEQPPAQFLKWDCRSGNAAIDNDGKVSWFDFEYSGRRHGAEDFAWLIGDEIWPLSADLMFDVIRDEFDPGTGHQRDDYLDYLGIYSTFHTLQRILLILREVDRRGWRNTEQVRRYDKVGAHPLLGEHISKVGAFCADRSGLTRPMRPMFELMAATFAEAMPPTNAAVKETRLAG